MTELGSSAGGHCLRRALAVLVGAALWCTSGTARAQVSIWDLAKHPKLARAELLLRSVERMLARSDEARFDPSMQADFTRSALAMLELAGGRALPDVRLRYLLGDLLVDRTVGRYREARTILRRALRQAPGHPLAAQGWFDLAIADAKLGKPKEEIDAYGHALDLTWQPDQRANIYLNRAESRMVLGDLKGAVSDYRRAIPLAQRPELQALAYYGLGITLERSGDLPSALDATATASSIKFPGVGSALDLSTVFFVPSYDVYYYRALEKMAAARPPAKPAAAARALSKAIADWSTYLSRARPDRARWVQHAELLRASCEKKLQIELVRTRAKRRRPKRSARSVPPH